MIAEPSLAGSCQVTVTLPLPEGTTTGAAGAAGAVSMRTAGEADEAGESPTSLWATTVKEWRTPLDRPVSSQEATVQV